MTDNTHRQVPAIQRYKIGYHSDEWGVRSSTPGGISDPSGQWVLYKDYIAALVEAQQPAPSGAVALSDYLRDRLVAISEAIADQDDRAAQAMLREILAAPQPSPTAPATQQPEGDVVAYLDVGANGYLDLGAALSEDALQQLPKGRHALVIAGTYGIDGYVAAPQPSPTAQADSVLEDAARWRMLPAFFEEYQIDAMKLYRDIDAYLDAARKQGANHD